LDPTVRNWLAKTLHGLTGRRMAVVAALAFWWCLFSWPVGFGIERGLPATDIAIAVVFVFLGVVVEFLPALLVAVAVYNRMPGHALVRSVVAGIAILATLLCTAPLGFGILAPGWAISGVDANAVPIAGWLPYNWALTAVLVAAIGFMTYDDDTARSLETEELNVIRLESGLIEARLQATQAQIEPHFLFNTLANIRRLYHVDPIGARAMLQQFSQMLDATLPRMREARSTLGRELALALAYLSVQKIRMGSRLEFETAVPSSLDDAALPPMMLSTLVENAIKHGLAPLPQGGVVRIAAEATGDRLRVTVTDSGCGLRESAGPGVGLANIDARLAASFGRAAMLSLDPNADGGVTAILEVPLQFGTAVPETRNALSDA